MSITNKLVIMVMGSLLFTGCGDKNKTGGDSDFDRTAMLQHYADNIIIPSFETFQVNVSTLQTAILAFTSTPSTTTLDAAQLAFDNTYTAWMSCNSFNFGPAGEEGIRKGLIEEIGTWPANTTLIENNISTNNTSLNDFNRSNRGLNALDYLLFNLNEDDNAIVNSFLANNNRSEYTIAVVNKIANQTNEVLQAWKSSYRNDFVNSNGTSVGSSISQMYNEFVRSFESIKNFKVGLPLGKRIGQTSTEPETVETRFSGQSRKYIEIHIEAIDRQWHGRTSAGADGPGWKEYLQSVTGGSDLVARTETQMNNIRNALASLSESPSMEEQININFPAWENLHTQLQIQLPNYKSEMSSLLGIAITFSSGDGD
jgi:hypothetical protein